MAQTLHATRLYNDLLTDYAKAVPPQSKRNLLYDCSSFSDAALPPAERAEAVPQSYCNSSQAGTDVPLPAAALPRVHANCAHHAMSHFVP